MELTPQEKAYKALEAARARVDEAKAAERDPSVDELKAIDDALDDVEAQEKAAKDADREARIKRIEDEHAKALEARDESYLSSMPAPVLVEGTSEIRNWIITAGAMRGGARMVDYVPCYRNDKGVGCAMGFAVWQ